MTETAEAVPPWRAAEERVASLYRALGYTVVRDILVQGSQIDLVAEQRMSGLGPVRIGVEVKDHPNGSLPIDEVRSFASTAQLLTGSGEFDQMHLVTTGAVTKNGREVVRPLRRARLMTYDELERELFNPDPSLRRWLEHYRSKPINKRYVDVQATLLDFDSRKPVEVAGRPVSTSLLDVAVDNPHLAIVVLADYGSGKTTMLERIKALSIERRSEQPDAPVPVLIRLRDIEADFNVDEVAIDAVRAELGLTLPSETFWSLLANGRFLMLLDGFDEITLRASEATRAQMLSRISPLIFNPSPAILTSRPSYFASLEEYRTLLERVHSGRTREGPLEPAQQRVDQLVARLADRYRDSGIAVPLDSQVATYRLDPLSSDQIDTFLELVTSDLESVGTSPQDVRAFLDSVYDLSDLISRPIILDMAVASIVEGHINPNQRTMADGPAGLYEAYAQVQLERDWENVENRRNLLPYEVRMRFAEECALLMHESGALRVQRSEIAAVAKRVYPSSSEDLQEVLTDLRTCSFLTVDEAGGLEFIHRSYQEFFVARRIRHDLEAKNTSRLREPLRWEYAYFLGSMGFTDHAIHQLFTEYARARTPSQRDDPRTVVADNAAQALLVAREFARDLDWRDRRVTELRRPRVLIEKARLQAVELLGLDVGEIEFIDCTLDVRADASSLGQLNVTNCSGALETNGTIGAISAIGGKLELQDRSSAKTLGFDSLDLALRCEGSATDCRFKSVTGSAMLTESTVELVDSEMTLTLDGLMAGSISDSLIDVSLAGWDRIAAQVCRSVVVVRDRQGRRSLSTTTRRPRKVTDETPAGCDSVVVVDPSVPVDRWWKRQSRLVTIGANLGDAPAEFDGLFVHEVTQHNAKEPADVLEVRRNGHITLVIEGRGQQFNAARLRLSNAVQNATASSVASGIWINQQIRPLLLDIGFPIDAADELGAIVRSRLHAEA